MDFNNPSDKSLIYKLFAVGLVIYAIVWAIDFQLIGKFPDFLNGIIVTIFGAILSGWILGMIVDWQLNVERKNMAEMEEEKRKIEKEKELALLQLHKSRISSELNYNYMIIKNIQYTLTLKPKVNTAEHWVWLLNMCNSFSSKAYDSLVSTGLLIHLDKDTEIQYYTFYHNIDYIKNKINFYNVQLHLLDKMIDGLSSDPEFNKLIEDVETQIKLWERMFLESKGKIIIQVDEQ